ncbi:helix-turn-helix transcriptional regulator [Pontibacillus salipaludis]|uniref:helix-turn-helix domain-containing protein n=1 Tax=Pontibacillus salipaludis TaxID=1697394 RepID=UPI0031E59618
MENNTELPGNRAVQLKVGELLHKRELTQAKLSDMTGIRRAAISQLSRGYVDRVSLDHLTKIADALELDDISELITIERTK